MSNTQDRQPTESDSDDPLGFGLKSIDESLQRWWLIGKGNPCFDAEVREVRPPLRIPEAGFENAAEFVDWAATRGSRHGHAAELGVSFNFDGHILENAEDLTRFHHRDISWPIHESDIPGPGCSSNPLYAAAQRLAVRFGIDRAGSEPEFPRSREAVVGFLLIGLATPKVVTGQELDRGISLCRPQNR